MNARLMSKDHDLSKDVLGTQQCNVPLHGTPSALQINQGMLILVRTNAQLYSGVKTQKHPSMTRKAAKKPAI